MFPDVLDSSEQTQHDCFIFSLDTKSIHCCSKGFVVYKNKIIKI